MAQATGWREAESTNLPGLRDLFEFFVAFEKQASLKWSSQIRHDFSRRSSKPAKSEYPMEYSLEMRLRYRILQG